MNHQNHWKHRVVQQVKPRPSTYGKVISDGAFCIITFSSIFLILWLTGFIAYFIN